MRQVGIELLSQNRAGFTVHALKMKQGRCSVRCAPWDVYASKLAVPWEQELAAAARAARWSRQLLGFIAFLCTGTWCCQLPVLLGCGRSFLRTVHREELANVFEVCVPRANSNITSALTRVGGSWLLFCSGLMVRTRA